VPFSDNSIIVLAFKKLLFKLGNAHTDLENSVTDEFFERIKAFLRLQTSIVSQIMENVKDLGLTRDVIPTLGFIAEDVDFLAAC